MCILLILILSIDIGIHTKTPPVDDHIPKYESTIADQGLREANAYTRKHSPAKTVAFENDIREEALRYLFAFICED